VNIPLFEFGQIISGRKRNEKDARGREGKVSRMMWNSEQREKAEWECQLAIERGRKGKPPS